MPCHSPSCFSRFFSSDHSLLALSLISSSLVRYGSRLRSIMLVSDVFSCGLMEKPTHSANCSQWRSRRPPLQSTEMRGTWGLKLPTVVFMASASLSRGPESAYVLQSLYEVRHMVSTSFSTCSGLRPMMDPVIQDSTLSCASVTALKSPSYGSRLRRFSSTVGFTVGFHPKISSCSLTAASSSTRASSVPWSLTACSRYCEAYLASPHCAKDWSSSVVAVTSSSNFFWRARRASSMRSSWLTMRSMAVSRTGTIFSGHM
mmetsp:Transcript_31449/g.79947  ORF Transcript_31449/g.79947 Transcript_31449/m.79947 type:complete len:259 (+) Transcript_31449:1343-2119(+)